MGTSSSENELEQQAQAALAKVKLDLFTAEPAAIEPFASSQIGWQVTVPEEYDVSVDLDIDGTPVATGGEFLVSPASTRSYSLRARALSHSRILGTVTVQVDLRACVALSSEPVELVADVIKYQINTDKSGIHFRDIPDQLVSIQDDAMVITLRLAQTVLKYIVDAHVDIDASFALQVIPIPEPPPPPPVLTAKLPSVDYDFHQLAPADIEINVDVSVPWYVWLVPGAMLGLPIAISGAKADASRKTNKMINDIVDLLNGWFSQTSVQPPRMDKHDAGFYVSPPGNELFWINFCPVPGRVPVRVQ